MFQTLPLNVQIFECTNIIWGKVIYFTTMIVVDRVKVSLDVLHPQD
jgi:hypothetical protein